MQRLLVDRAVRGLYSSAVKRCVKARFRVFLCGLIILGAWEAFAASEEPGRVTFGIFGDLPYNAAEEAVFPQLIEEMNRDRDLDFVVHVGDFKDGGFTRCSDAVFRRARTWLDLSTHPLIYTPGDNEWTDCHRLGLGGYDSLERLARLREIFFENEQSLGQRALPLARQSKDPVYAEFRENARWVIEGVVFATLHVVGSNNNLGRAANGDAEHRKRMTATLSWMKDAFALARTKGMGALVLIMHADPKFDEKPGQRTGFNLFLSELEAGARELKKPVLLVHGDGHTFRVDRPFDGKTNGRPVENLTRLETFGSPHVGWVKVTVAPAAVAPFRFEPAGFEKKPPG